MIFHGGYYNKNFGNKFTKIVQIGLKYLHADQKNKISGVYNKVINKNFIDVSSSFFKHFRTHS